MRLGLNYTEHALEGGRADRPGRTRSCAVSRRSSVLTELVKRALTSSFDYEGELGMVIGAGGRYIPAGKAFDAIAGFTVLNGASARDWQRAGSQWTPGKKLDGSMPIGPEVVTPDEVDITDVALTTVLNGQVMRSARTSQMLVDVPSAVELFSSFTTLRPGDVLAAGTPGGVGFRASPRSSSDGGRIENHRRGRWYHPQPRGRRVLGDRSEWRWRPAPSSGGL